VSVPVIPQEAARRFILDRQGLLTPYSDPLEALRAVVAVQTQYAASLAVALGARCRSLPAGWEAEAFNETRCVVKSWTLRATLHAHRWEDYPTLVGTLQDRLVAHYTRWMTRHLGVDEGGLEALQQRILAALAEPSARPALHEAVPELQGMPYAGWGADVRGLAYRGQVVLAPAGPGPTRFVHCERWLGPCRPLPAAEATARLLRAYLHAHGPATPADFRYWTLVPASQVRAAFAALRDELAEVRVEGMAGARYLLASDLESLRADRPAPPLQLLAKFDPLLMGWKDKSLFLDPAEHARVFRKAGQVEATVLRDGRVAGTWRLLRGARPRITVEPHRGGARLTAAAEARFRRLLADAPAIHGSAAGGPAR
jgi:hypothetical protein